jgi:DeoR family fructose operon transcriptional repressor
MSENPSELRRRLILDRARDDGRVQVTDLAIILDVAAETVRRDLQALEDQGLLRRTHGGALPIDKAGFETQVGQRSTQAMAEKGRIADAALRLLDACESLFIDEGSTALAVAERLLTIDRPLTIVTHSIPVAAALTPRPNTEVLLLGGRVRSASIATIGSSATAMLSDLTIDMAVLGASGISLERGLSTSDLETAELKRVAMDAARQRLFVGDHTKFGISSFCHYADVQEFNAVITGRGLPNSVAARYKAEGTRLIRV